MKKVLIVDDDAAVRVAYREILAPRDTGVLLQGEALFGNCQAAREPSSYEIEEAVDGLEAIDKVREAKNLGQPFGVAFMDMKMPGLNGAETTREIWAIDPHIKVAIVTAFSDISPDDIVRVAGRNDLFYLKKPFNPQEIRQFARALCNQWVFDKYREKELGRRETLKTESLACMAGAMAHHLNNLLAVVSGNLEMLREDLPAGSNLCHFVDRAEMGARRGADLGRHLLTYLGQRMDEKSYRNLSVEVYGSLSMIEKFFPRQVRLETRLAPNLPMVNLDGDAFHEVLMGLTTNAWEAIGQEEGTVTITTGTSSFSPSRWRKVVPPEEAVAQYVYVEVADDGSGMGAETLERMFDPFFSTKFMGRGLGLAAVQGVVQSHDGWIGVSGTEGEGTTLGAFFPAVPMPL